MKQLIAGIVILVVVGIAGFLYRNTIEHPISPSASGTSSGPVACTMEAKLCPNGASVGRTGTNCEFSACPFPNVAFASAHAAFAVPEGYAENKNSLGDDASLLAAYEKPAKAAGTSHAIVVRDYAIPAGKTATSTILANTMYESSGMQPKSMSEFKTKIVGGKTFYCATLERFEGQVHTACYLPRAADVLRFEVLEKDVDWTNPKLDIDALPEHQAFYGMLGTLQLP